METGRRSFVLNRRQKDAVLQGVYGSDGTRTRDLRRDRPAFLPASSATEWGRAPPARSRSCCQTAPAIDLRRPKGQVEAAKTSRGSWSARRIIEAGSSTSSVAAMSAALARPLVLGFRTQGASVKRRGLRGASTSRKGREPRGNNGNARRSLEFARPFVGRPDSAQRCGLAEPQRTGANGRSESTSWGSLVRAQYRP